MRVRPKKKKKIVSHVPNKNNYNGSGLIFVYSDNTHGY